jgi:alpha-tubulin suppressor-like RCC1 family protein
MKVKPLYVLALLLTVSVTYAQFPLPTPVRPNSFPLQLPAEVGTVAAWGARNISNFDYGQTTIPEGLTNVVQVAAGGYHTLALKSDGKVVAWGAGYAPPYDPYDPYGWYNSNYYWGNYGWPHNSQAAVPAGLTDVVQIDAGWNHSTALKSDGTVLEWGNGHGASGATEIVQISVSSFHTLALKMDGTVLAWGYNWDGSGSVSPAPPEGVSNVVKVAAGENFSLALLGNGTVLAWGSDQYGALNVPEGLTDVVDIGAGSQAIALKSDGTLVTWGTPYGQETDSSQLIGQTFKNVSASAAYSLAINSSGLAVGWGYPWAGQLEFWNVAYWPEYSYPGWDTERPDANWFQKELVQIDAGITHAVALVKGARPEIQVEESDGRKFQSNTATDFSKPRTYTIRNTGDAPLTGLALSLIGEHASEFAPVALEKTELQPGETLSVSVNFNAAGAGFRNAQLQIASNDATENPFIVNLTGFGGLKRPDFSGIVTVSGSNEFGQANVPAGLTGIVQVAAGSQHTLALRKDGRLFSWGDNSNNQTLAPNSEIWPSSSGWDSDGHSWSQFFNGNYYRSWTVPGDIIQVAAGDYHTLVLNSPGIVSSWGANWNGQIGGGYSQVLGPVAQIAAGSTHSVLLQADGKVVSWGGQNSGSAPWPLFGVVQISASGDLTVALKNDGTVVAWGAIGQSGNSWPNSPWQDYSVPWWANQNNNNSWNYRPPWIGDVFGRWTRENGNKITRSYAVNRYDLNYYSRPSYSIAFNNQGGSHVSNGWWNQLDESSLKNSAYGYAHTVSIQPSFDPEIEVESPGDRVSQSGKQALILVQKDQPSASSTLVVKNTGYSDLVNLSVSISGPQASLFSVSSFVSPSLSPDGNSTLTVNFTPNSPGTMAATLRIESNDSDEPIFEIPLIGRSFPMGGPEKSGVAVALGSNLPDSLQNFMVGLGAVKQIHSFGDGALFLGVDGSVRHWSSYPNSLSDVPTDLTDAIQVAGSSQVGVAVRGNGQIVAWGDRAWEVPTWLGEIIQVTLGSNYGFLLSANGTVTGWGPNTQNGGYLAVPGELYANTLQIQTAGDRALALKSNGQVVSWGQDPDNLFRVPNGLENVTQISISNSHALALKSDGTVVAWGQDLGGNLAVPADLVGVTKISAGDGYSLALKQDGTVVLWGTSWFVETMPTSLFGGAVEVVAGNSYGTAFSIIGGIVPVISSLPTAKKINFGNTLSHSTLNGGSAVHNGTTVEGYFAFAYPNLLPQGGVSSQKVIFYPNDIQRFLEKIFFVDVSVEKLPSEIFTLPDFSPIFQGQSLSSINLTGGTASVSGSFAFASPQSSFDAGNHTQEIIFTPTDSANYTTISTNVTVTVLDPESDEDSDGLKNSAEFTQGTNYFVSDTDGDGFSDKVEIDSASNPLLADSKPDWADTDGDGVTDYREIADGTNPVDPYSFEGLSQGLVIYYPFQGNLQDQSGFKNDLVLAGGNLTRGRSDAENSALQVGIQDGAKSESNVGITGNSNFTVSFWMKPTQQPKFPEAFVVGWGAIPTQDGKVSHFYYRPYQSSTNLDIDEGNVGARVQSHTANLTGIWSHITYTYHSANRSLAIYRNGVLQTTNYQTYNMELHNLGDSKLYLGGTTKTGDHPPDQYGGRGLAGNLDDVRVYNRTLTGSEVRELYVAEAMDETAPQISLLGENPMVVFKGGLFTDPGAIITDNADATWTILGNGTVNTSTVGNQTITYSASDLSGNIASNVVRTVIVMLDPNGDEDADGLNNAVETNTGAFVSPDETGTNPFIADTNGDGFSDGEAVGAGLNPLTNYAAAISLVKQLSALTPGRFDLYTTDAMMDLNLGALTIQKNGQTLTVELQLQSTTNLATQPFTNLGAPVEFQMEMPGNKGFLRVHALGSQ